MAALPTSTDRKAPRTASSSAFQVQADLLQRHDQAVFAVNFEGAVSPLNPVAGALGANWSDDDRANFADAVLTADRSGSATIDELVVGDCGAPARLQITLLRLAGTSGLLCFTKNVSLDREFYLALADSRRRYRDFADLAGEFQWETGPDGRFTFVGPSGGFSFTAEQLLELDPLTLLAERPDDHTNPFTCHQPISHREFWLWRRDGDIAPAMFSSRPLYSPDGVWIGARGVCRDISDLRASQSSNTEAQWQLEAVIDITRVVESGRSNSLGPLLDVARRIFGADGCQVALRHSGPADDELESWSILAQSGLSDASQDAVKSVVSQMQPPLVSAVIHSGWRVLAIPLEIGGRQLGVLLLWRRATLGGWGADHRGLASAIAPLASLQVTRFIANEAATAAVAPTQPPELIATGLARRVKRSLYAGLESAFITLDVDMQACVLESAAAAACGLLEKCDFLSRMVRGNDFVVEISPTRVGIWLEKISADVAKERGEFLRGALEARVQAGGGTDVEVALNVFSVSPTASCDVDELVASVCGRSWAASRTGPAEFRTSQHVSH